MPKPQRWKLYVEYWGRDVDFGGKQLIVCSHWDILPSYDEAEWAWVRFQARNFIAEITKLEITRVDHHMVLRSSTRTTSLADTVVN